MIMTITANRTLISYRPEIVKVDVGYLRRSAAKPSLIGLAERSNLLESTPTIQTLTP